MKRKVNEGKANQELSEHFEYVSGCPELKVADMIDGGTIKWVCKRTSRKERWMEITRAIRCWASENRELESTGMSGWGWRARDVNVIN